MNLGPALGRFQYLRGKSQFWVEGVRQWIVPGGIAGGFANKVLSVSPEWSLVVALVLPVVVETLGFFWGRFLWERGGVEAEYALAAQKDPFKRESLERFKAIETLLREMKDDRWTAKPLSAMSDAASAEILRLLEQACRPCWEGLAERVKDTEWADSARRNPRPDER